MKYKSVVATKRGGPEVLEVHENELSDPPVGKVRLKTLAASVSLPDVEARYGRSPFPPKYPFTPGYSIVGVVEEVGKGVRRIKAGDRAAALTVYGGYSEVIYLAENRLIPVPEQLDPVEVVPLILNYIVAYQTLHRTARVKAGQSVLLIGASGGIGTAFLQLGRLAGLKMYGLASKTKHAILAEYGATAIDYQTQDFVQVIRQMEPDGLDAVFDGVGRDYQKRGFGLLKRGGIWVGYANPESIPVMLSRIGTIIRLNLSRNGRKASYYGSGMSQINMRSFLEDWSVLFELLGSRKIAPVIAAKFPLLEARQANELLESRQVTGNIVLVAPDLF